MSYSNVYMMNHDIDWFCVVNNVYIHVASAGGKLPNQINDEKRLRYIQHQVEMLPDIFSNEEIEYNEPAITKVIGEIDAKGKKLYLQSFTAMAKKGFVSFDRTYLADTDDQRYHWVCRPKYLTRKPQIFEIENLQIEKDMNDFQELFALIMITISPKLL